MKYKEYQFFLEADRLIAGRPVNSLKVRVKRFFGIVSYIESFMRLLRKLEYLDQKISIIDRLTNILVKRKFDRLSLKLGFSIPINVFGPGLYIPHYGTIVVNPNAKVGKNCVLHTSTCIAGSEKKNIGDNVYISTGVIISGETDIASNTTISANSLVNKPFLTMNLLIGGTSAKPIKLRPVWFECEGHERFALAVEQIDHLHKSTFG